MLPGTPRARNRWWQPKDGPGRSWSRIHSISPSGNGRRSPAVIPAAAVATTAAGSTMEAPKRKTKAGSPGSRATYTLCHTSERKEHRRFGSPALALFPTRQVAPPGWASFNMPRSAVCPSFDLRAASLHGISPSVRAGQKGGPAKRLLEQLPLAF